MNLFIKLYYFTARFCVLCALCVTAQAVALADANLDNVKALIYSNTAAELQWERIEATQVQVSYNGAVVGSYDANSYFNDKLDPSVTHQFQLRAVASNGDMSGPIEITFNTNNFTLPVREIQVQSANTVSGSSQATLSDVRLLVYSDSAVELFWTRFGSNSTLIEVVHNGQSLGAMDKSSLYLEGLGPETSHSFQVKPTLTEGLEAEWFSVSVDLQDHSQEVREIVATRVVEEPSLLELSPPPPQSQTTDSLSQAELPAVQSEAFAEIQVELQYELDSTSVTAPAVAQISPQAVDDAPVVEAPVSSPILAGDCVVRNLSDLTSCVDSAQGLERINIQSDLSCSQNSCCPTGGALLRFNAVSNLTIEGNGHKLVRSAGQRQCSLLDVTQSQSLVLNNWTLDDDAAVSPCVVNDECPRMLHIRNSSNVTLSNMNIRNGKGYVIYVQQVNGFNFLNSSLSNSGVLGLYVGHSNTPSTNVRIQHSTFLDNQTNAVALLGVSGSSVNDNIVSNNVFRRNHWRGQWAVEPRYGSGFTGGGQMYIAQASGLTISDNLIEDGYCENCFVQQFMGSGVSGIELAMPGRNSVTNTLIKNNTVNNHDAWGIFVNEGSSLDSSVVITNNQLRNNTVGLKPGSTSAYSNTIVNR